MSNEIRISTTIRVANGDVKLNWTPGSIQFDQEEAGVYHRVVELDGASNVFDTAVSGFSAHKLVMVRFLELIGGSGATGSLKILPTNGSEFYTLEEGEFSIFKSDDFNLELTDDPGSIEIIILAE